MFENLLNYDISKLDHTGLVAPHQTGKFALRNLDLG